MSQMAMLMMAGRGMSSKAMKKAMRGYCVAVLWEAFEEDLGMGEQAALAAVCETLNIDLDHAHECMAVASQSGLFGDDDDEGE